MVVDAEVGQTNRHSSERAEWCAQKKKKGERKIEKQTKKDLTEPTLLSRWEKRGRGGTKDVMAKLLNGIQQVEVLHGQSEHAGR